MKISPTHRNRIFSGAGRSLIFSGAGRSLIFSGPVRVLQTFVRWALAFEVRLVLVQLVLGLPVLGLPACRSWVCPQSWKNSFLDYGVTFAQNVTSETESKELTHDERTDERNGLPVLRTTDGICQRRAYIEGIETQTGDTEMVTLTMTDEQAHLLRIALEIGRDRFADHAAHLRVTGQHSLASQFVLQAGQADILMGKLDEAEELANA